MIEVKNLTFSYAKDKQALHGLDFTVGDGEIFGFLGPNGSGKSTTQKILAGILKGIYYHFRIGICPVFYTNTDERDSKTGQITEQAERRIPYRFSERPSV